MLYFSMSNFRVGTYNLHVNAVKRHPDDVVRDIVNGITDCHVLSLNEAGQAEHLIKRACIAAGNAAVYYGEGDAARSTPIIYRRTLEVLNKHSYLLTPRTDTNEPKAAGPTVVKEKRLNAITFAVNGRRVTYAGIHTTPSVWADRHGRLNAEQIDDAAAFLARLRGVKIIGGDFNALPDHRNLQALTKRGFVSTQRQFGPVGTNGKRAIDDIYIYGGEHRIKVTNRHLILGASDHRMYVVNCFVTPRKVH